MAGRQVKASREGRAALKTPSGLTSEAQLDWLRLIRSRRVGPVTFHRLRAEHGSCRAALEALPEIARAAGVDGYRTASLTEVEAELAKGRDLGLTPLFHGLPPYPAELSDLGDAPPFLWARGDITLLSRPRLALVGARNVSSLGTRMARRLGADLGQRGYAVVSGLARGVDAEAHWAALATGTIAVLAGGVDVAYPEENSRLYGEVAARGLCLSEQPLGLQPQARHFPLRNRIIAGLSQAVVVVEAAAKSGSLITAREALDLGREVLAVPGHPFDARAAGCNFLIRDGAVLVRNAEDIFEALGVISPVNGDTGEVADPADMAGTGVPEMASLAAPPLARPSMSLDEAVVLHGLILERLGPSPVSEDQLLRDINLPASQIAPELLALELEGRIARQPGGLIARS